MAQRLSSPPPYGYHIHQKSYSETNLAASRVEASTIHQPAKESQALHYLSAADYYSAASGRDAHSYNNAIGIEITLLSSATRRSRRPSRWSKSDDRGYSRVLDPSAMSQYPQQQQGSSNSYQNITGEAADHHASLSAGSYDGRYVPPPVPPLPGGQTLPQNVEKRNRKESTTSGTSAYTGYDNGTSSPSSHDHAVPLPASTAPDPKEVLFTDRLYVQNGTSSCSDDGGLTPKPSRRPSSAPHPRSKSTTRPTRPPPIMTRDQNGSPRQVPGSHQSPPTAPATYSPVAAYMTTPHEVAFNTSPSMMGAYSSPKTAPAGAGFGLVPVATAQGSVPRNASSPEYRKNQRKEHRYVGLDGYNGRSTGRGTMDHVQEVTYNPSGSNMDSRSPGLQLISAPVRKQPKTKPVVTHACMTLSRTDRLRLIKFPQSAVYAIKSAIERSWVKGIQKEKEATGQTEIQLKGNPWSGQGDDTSYAVYMVCEVMSALYHLGWHLVMSTDISKRALDKDTMIYRNGEIPTPCSFMAVSFNEGDRLRLTNAPNDVINAVKNTWGGNIQRESWKLKNVAWEFKLTGSPWWSTGDESLSVRILLLNMLDALHALEWELHTSVDITAGPGGLGKNAGADTDCWILRKVIT